MKYQLINKPNNNFSTIQQILYNRGIDKDKIAHYLNLSDNDINSPLLLGEYNLKNGLLLIINTIKNNSNAVIIIDCDCDGYTSAALFINYLYKLFPTWVIDHLDWIMHDSKQHGLADCYQQIAEGNIITKKDGLTIDSTDEMIKIYRNSERFFVLSHKRAFAGSRQEAS